MTKTKFIFAFVAMVLVYFAVAATLRPFVKEGVYKRAQLEQDLIKKAIEMRQYMAIINYDAGPPILPFEQDKLLRHFYFRVVDADNDLQTFDESIQGYLVKFIQSTENKNDKSQ